MIKINTVAHVPENLARVWLQYLRDFDTAHPGCHFEVLMDAPTMPLGKMLDAMKISPPLDVLDIFPRSQPK